MGVLVRERESVLLGGLGASTWCVKLRQLARVVVGVQGVSSVVMVCGCGAG